MLSTVTQAIEQMNAFGHTARPFLFLLDFEMEQPLVIPLDEVDPQHLQYAVNDGFLQMANYTPSPNTSASIELTKTPVPKQAYKQAFDLVMSELLAGNSFLTNLTAETSITLNVSLEEVFNHAVAKYIVYMPGRFLCYSPETFIQITAAGELRSCPIKGSLSASFPDAEAKLLGNNKELYEHTTIVDLIRNDISQIAEKVWVERFRYLDVVRKQSGEELLQMTSDIRGQLAKGWQSQLGTLLCRLLPAGSVSGAPKAATVASIRRAERFTYHVPKRGYYTGIFGIFDGNQLSSSVLIRFIEKQPNGLVYKSGGGITSRSNWESEYEELLQKIYIPV